MVSASVTSSSYLLDYCDGRLELSAAASRVVAHGSGQGLKYEWFVGVHPSSPDAGPADVQLALDRLASALQSLALVPSFAKQNALVLPLVAAKDASQRNQQAAQVLDPSLLALPLASLGQRVMFLVRLRARDASMGIDSSSPLGSTRGTFASLSVMSVGAPRPVLTPRNTSALVAGRM